MFWPKTMKNTTDFCLFMKWFIYLLLMNPFAFLAVVSAFFFICWHLFLNILDHHHHHLMTR